jgi:hypothetical protein
MLTVASLVNGCAAFDIREFAGSFRSRGGIVSRVVILLAASFAEGVVLGLLWFRWPAILLSGAVFALVAAWVSRTQGLGPFLGIAVIAVCLTLNQLAFIFGAMLRIGPGRNADE